MIIDCFRESDSALFISLSLFRERARGGNHKKEQLIQQTVLLKLLISDSLWSFGDPRPQEQDCSRQVFSLVSARRLIHTLICHSDYRKVL